MNSYLKSRFPYLALIAIALVLGVWSLAAQAQEEPELKLSRDSGIVDPEDGELHRTKGNRQRFPDLDVAPLLEFRKVYHFTFAELDPADTDLSDGRLPLFDADGKPITHEVFGADVIATMDEGFGAGISSAYPGTVMSMKFQRIFIPVRSIEGFEKLIADQLGSKQLWVVRTLPTSAFPDFVIAAPPDQLAEILAKYQGRKLVKAVFEAPAAPPLQEAASDE